MEIFIDGGLFELLIAVAFGYAINYLFSKKILLVLFSIMAVTTPVLLLFFKQGEGFYFLVFLCLFNSVLLVVLLWKWREQKPDEPLFDIHPYTRPIRRFLTKRKKRPGSLNEDRNKKPVST